MPDHSIPPLPIRDTREGPPCSVVMTQANGWLVTLTCGEGYMQHPFYDDWNDARDCYVEPPKGWQAIAISACDKDRVPFARLSAFDIAQLRSGA